MTSETRTPTILRRQEPWRICTPWCPLRRPPPAPHPSGRISTLWPICTTGWKKSERRGLTFPSNLLYFLVARQGAGKSGVISLPVPSLEASGPGRSEVGYEFRIERSRASRIPTCREARRSTPGFLFSDRDSQGSASRASWDAPPGAGEKAL